MTLRQAVERALQQNPELAMARLDEVKAREAVRSQKDPFSPHVFFGSGLAYTNGFPMSIDGAAPSIVQARVSQYLFNRQQSYAIARTKEEARGAGIAASAKKDDVAYRTAVLFLDAERAARAVELARKEVESSQKVLSTVSNRVEEGRELPLESKRAALNLARAKQAAESLDADRETAETSLAIVLGYSADDRVRPSLEERPAPPMPATEDAAVESALSANKELRLLESQIAGERVGGPGGQSCAPAACGPGRAVRPVRHLQSLSGLLLEVPAQQRRDRGVVRTPGSGGTRRSARQRHEAGGGRVEASHTTVEHAQPDHRRHPPELPRCAESRNPAGGRAAGFGSSAGTAFRQPGAICRRATSC